MYRSNPKSILKFSIDALIKADVFILASILPVKNLQV
jgi:hypothetical protein